MLCLGIFSPALTSPMLYCNIIPHWPQKCLAVLVFFSTLSLLFLSLITYFLCGRRHLVFVLAHVVFWLRTDRAATDGREPDTLLEFTPTASVHCWTPFPLLSLLLYLPLSQSFLTFLHMLVLSLLPVIPSVRPCFHQSAAARVQLNPERWPHFYDTFCKLV